MEEEQIKEENIWSPKALLIGLVVVLTLGIIIGLVLAH